MPKLPRPTGKELVRFLKKQRFTLVRIEGSHHIFAKGRLHTSVPVHGNKNLKIGTFRSILRDIEMTPDQYIRSL